MAKRKAASVTDLLEALRESVAVRRGETATAVAHSDLDDLSKDDLIRARGVRTSPGRSRMSRTQLLEALRG